MLRPIRVLLAALLWSLLALAAGAGPLRIAVLSDVNGSYGSTSYAPEVGGAVRRIIAMRPDLVIATGDLVAGQQARPKFSRAQLLAMWHGFDETVTEPLRQAGIPLVVTPGNHDASIYPAYAHERAVFDEVWRPRKPRLDYIDAGGYPFRFAFSMGGVTLVSLDATGVGALPDEQMNWLDGILAPTAPADPVVLFSHIPPLPFAQGRETEIIGDPALLRMLETRGVDLYLSGHHHAYYPGVKDGVLYIGQSCLGGGPRALIGDDRTSPKSFTMVEIAETGEVHEYALASPDFRQPIPLAALPPAIGSGDARMVRHDLAPR